MIRRRDRDRGAILVELAFVVPVLILIVTGMFEMGMAWRDKISTTQAVRQSVRVASHLGNQTSSDVDHEALQALRASMNDQWDQVEYVVVYKADTNGEISNNSCYTASVANVCNHYPIGDLNTKLDLAGDPYWDQSAAAWKWGTRNNSILNPDHVGIYVALDYQWRTGMFPGDGVTITGQAVMRVEPDVG